MSITSLPIVSVLRERMQWHQARQKVLAENVANANMPGFRPHDLVSPQAADGSAGGTAALSRTNPLHLAAAGGDSEGRKTSATLFETRPSGNAVDLESEMLKIADNQSDYQLAASLYQKSLAMLRTAAGARG